ncbi:hypothetical protein GIB67_034800 [Kingdonia uniflora]|uniref:Uncharacterized protein n=1 Tax=Kingdonia uniflora TaxID=39325 RepID=A0A7J7MEA8_9MAGN|nr:hypothetical protein GIB67_034800 [Kingdonia uniflora]
MTPFPTLEEAHAYYLSCQSRWSPMSPISRIPSETMAVRYAHPAPPSVPSQTSQTRVFQFLAGLNLDFEYARVHLFDRTPFPTLEEAYAYYLSGQSRWSPMSPISGIPSKTSAMAVRYAHPAPPSVPSQTSQTRVFQFLAGLNLDFEYARVHLLDRTPFPTLEEAHAYYLSGQSRWSPMSPISGIPSKTSAMAVRYAHPAPPSVPSQTSQTRVFQFLAGLNLDFEYARVHLLDRTPFPTLEEAHAYYLSGQSRWSPMSPISGIPSETSAMAVRYAHPAPPSVPSQTSHTSLPILSPLPASSGNSRPSRKKCDYCGKWGNLKTTWHALHGRPAGYQPRPSHFSVHLSADSSVPDSLAFSALS